MKDWKDESGQENSGSFYYARDDVRPAICFGLQDPRQQNHRHRDLHEYCDSYPRSRGKMDNTDSSFIRPQDVNAEEHICIDIVERRKQP